MSFTNPNVSDMVSQRRSSGWGQSMAFPGPPPMTIEDPGDVARESSITVEGANIRVPDMVNAFNMSYSPSLNSPVFNYQNNPSNTYFGLQIPYMQMQMQEIYQILGSFGSSIDSGVTTSVTVITGAALVGSNLQFSTTVLDFTGGLITSTSSGSAINIATATCA